MRDVPPTEAEVDRQLARVAGDLLADLPALTAAAREVLTTQIPELATGPRLEELLTSSIGSNLETFFQVLQHGLAIDRLEPPPAAFAYARRLAQHGVPVNALVRSYRLGQQAVVQVILGALHPRTMAPEVRTAAYDALLARSFGYIDRISQQVVGAYEREREDWLADRNAARAARVREVLAGAATDTADLETTLGYRLHGRHLAVVISTDDARGPGDQPHRSNRVLGEIAARLSPGREPLVIAQDRSVAWAWVPVGDAPVDDEGLRALCHPGPASSQTLVALGRVHTGLPGFRRSHREAVHAHRVALLRRGLTDPVVSYAQRGVGVVALLAQDVGALRQWVADTLGGLLVDDDQHQRLRETLLLFLRTSGSFTATAEQLQMHKNSVRYRITQAEKELGHPVSDDRQSLELALTACELIGADALT